MRIIGGQFKGKKILEPIDKITRPLKDLVKESIFNIIIHSKKFEIKIEGSYILDLFSGVGSFGLEALSRGSEHVTFVENYTEALKILKTNINNLKVNDKCNLIEKNIFENFSFDQIDNKFNIIFIDPPFKSENVNFLLDEIHKAKILKKNSLIILHRHSKENLTLNDNLKILEEKTYGISKIIFANYSN